MMCVAFGFACCVIVCDLLVCLVTYFCCLIYGGRTGLGFGVRLLVRFIVCG